MARRPDVSRAYRAQLDNLLRDGVPRRQAIREARSYAVTVLARGPRRRKRAAFRPSTLNPRRRRRAWRRNPDWVPTNYGDDSRKRSRRASLSSRARTQARRADGRFAKRGGSSGRTAPRAAAPRVRRAAAPRTSRMVELQVRSYHSRRGKKGKFATRYTEGYRKRQRRHNTKRGKTGKHYRAIRNIKKGEYVNGLVRLNPRTGEVEIMPKAIVANPRRRRRRRSRGAYVATNPRRRRRRRRVGNPRRRRSRRRVGNPRFNLVGSVKQQIQPAVAGLAGGAVAGFLDSKILPKKRLLQGVAKLGLSIVGARLMRRRPAAAYAFAGSMMGSIGYGVGLKLGGGMVANTKGEVISGLADLAAEDDGIAALLADSEDLGDLVTAGELADGEDDLADEDDDMSDLVEAD